MKKIFLLLSVAGCFCSCFTSKQFVTEKDMAAYLLVYFKDDTHGLYFALSEDGCTFTDVNNGNPVIAGDTIAEQRGIRDPYIMRGSDGWFYMAMTDLHIYGKQKGYRDTEWERPKELYDWGNNRGFVLMKSRDLIHWTHSVLDIHKAYPKLDVGCAWAPELIYDDKAGKIMIYFTMRKGKGKTKLYYAYMNKDFTALESEPKILFDYPDSTKQILDADITKLPDGRFCMMYVAQENPGGIKMAFSDRINGGYVYRPEQIDFEPKSCEAPNVWKRIGEDKWVLMYDIFSINPHNFGFAETSDFKTFTNLGHFDKGVMKRSNFSAQKHGAVIQLAKREAERLKQGIINDRRYWSNLAYKITAPILENMSRGELSKNMQLELSPTWDGRDKRVSYMEAFGRLMDGIAPWLSLPDDNTEEGKQRRLLRDWALKSYAQAVDPESPDYLLWRSEGQPLVDAAYIASSFLRAPKQLWEPLDTLTKQRYIAEFQQLRRIDPPYTNWLLFSATVETFLLSVNAQYDIYRIHSAIRKIEEWYVGDGWYSDGEHFAFDYYNSYVIQPMYIQVLEILVNQKIKLRDKNLEVVQRNLETAKKRMQRFGIILERFVSPEGTFPVFGRSMTYRLGVFQPLALLALKEDLPEELPEGQIRNALTCTMKRLFSVDGNFNEKGFLQLGFAGHQPNITDWYTNNGSLYLTSEVFLPLGLPANHSFWTSPAQDWTAKKAWSGADFPKDHAIKE